MPQSRRASALLNFVLRIPLGPTPLSLDRRLSVGPRCSALLPGMPAAAQHHTTPNPVPTPGLSPALGTSWLAPLCMLPMLTRHVAVCSARGSMGSSTRDIVSGDVRWGRKRCSPALGGSGQSGQLRVEPLCAESPLSSPMVPGTRIPQQFSGWPLGMAEWLLERKTSPPQETRGE